MINLDEAQLTAGGQGATSIEQAAGAAGLTPFLSRAATAAAAVCAKIELEIAQLDAADATAFLSDLGLSESGLDRVIRATYELLGYISFFTVGEDECRAWSIPRHTQAQAAASEIHSDIARGFIRAEVVGVRRIDRARLDGGVPRSWRGSPRGQGVRRSGRRHHQFPLRDMIDVASHTSVIVPAFNEGPSIRQLVADLQNVTRWHEILVVDDGSSDETGEQAAAAGARVIRHPYNKGNGAAVKTGIRQASGTFILIVDGDGQHQPADAVRLVSQLDRI